MLLMKDRSFLYELRAYPICIKVGEKKNLHIERKIISDSSLTPALSGAVLQAVLVAFFTCINDKVVSF